MTWRPSAQPGDARDRGMATVTALVLIFSFTAGAMIWLARDVNRTVSNRSAAQSIAFQAARAGAQEIGLTGLRSGDRVDVDERRAEAAATQAAQALFEGYGVSGRVVEVDVAADLVEVEVLITDPAGDVTGVGSARPETGT